MEKSLFWQENALFASKIKFNIFKKNFKWPGRSEEKISKNVDFSLWGNHATTQNTIFDIFKSTKIEKKWDKNHENHT